MILVMSTFQIVLKLPNKNVLFCSSYLYVKRRQGLVWLRQGGAVYESCLFDVLTYGPRPVCAWASVRVCSCAGGGVVVEEVEAEKNPYA